MEKVMLNRVLLFLLLTSAVWANRSLEWYSYIHPKPNSTYHNPQTTIIIKMSEQDAAHFSAQNIHVKGAQSGIHAGNIIRSGDTVIFKPDNAFNPNEKVSVSIFSPKAFKFDFYTCEPEPNTHPIQNFKKANALSAPQEVEPVRLINGVAVPSDFPEINIIQHSETAPGRAFFASTFFGSNDISNYVMILENDGTPYFYRRYSTWGLGSADFHVHPNGLLSFYKYEGGENGLHIILDENFAEIDTFRAANGYRTDNHEMLLLPNGHALLIAEDDIKVDMSKVIDGGRADATLQGNYVQEVDNKGNVYWEWRTWDHLEISESGENLKGGYIDYVHLNSIDIDYDGNYVLSLRNYDQVVKINSMSGEIIWRLGGVQNDFTINDNLPISRQHCMKIVPGSPNHYTIYDNGNNRSPNQTRGVEYAIDTERMVANKVWEYDYDKVGNQGIMGAVQRLPNGNTYIDWSAWPSGRACEVDADNNLVWEIETGGIASYRSWRFDWDGEMQQPYFILENLNTVIRLIFNKFGDADVARYNIYAGASPNNMSLLSSTTETWLDIPASELNESDTYWFYVTAVDNNGTESAPSTIEQTLVNPIEANENIVRNGSFESDEYWQLETKNGASATTAVTDDEKYQITISNGGSAFSDIIVLQDYLTLLNGKDYIFEFDAHASGSRVIEALVESSDTDPINYGQIGPTVLSRRSQHFKYTFLMNHNTDTEARIAFKCGGSSSDVYIDNVQLYYVDLSSELDALPKGWANQDIGNVATSGLAGKLDDVYLLRGSGNDIWNTADEFHYAYAQMKGDGEAIARVNSMTVTNEWAKAGVMMRETLDADSKHATMALTGANGTAFQRRIETSNESIHSAGSALTGPAWVRLVRSGKTFTGYESTDGQNWTQVASEQIEMPEKIYIGLAVTSHDDGVICEAAFEHVEFLNDYVNVDASDDQKPESLVLYPAYPNPFNSGTRIQFELPEQSHVELTVFDIRGREVVTLANKNFKAGTLHFDFDGTNIASGVYFYRLKTDRQTLTKKMMLVR